MRNRFVTGCGQVIDLLPTCSKQNAADCHSPASWIMLKHVQHIQMLLKHEKLVDIEKGHPHMILAKTKALSAVHVCIIV
jgi:hypothetical protein